MSLGDHFLARRLETAFDQIAEIHSALVGEGAFVATVREVLTQISTDVDAIEEDVPRVLAEVQRLLDQIASGDVELSAERMAEVTAMRDKLAALNSAMDAAVPPASTEPPVEEPTEPSEPPVDSDGRPSL